MQTLSTISQLDEKLAECDRAAAISDDAMRRVFATFRMDRRHGASDHPLSDEYRRFQLDLYEQLAGKPYRLQNEETVFDIDEAVRRPFPFCTGSPATTGDQLCAIGALLRRLDLPPGARVLEFGPGWGNTTMALASLGFQVTAVDIENRFCELIRRRAELLGVQVDVVNADFLWAESVDKPYDAAIFFECFHHCTDHLRLLRALHRALGPAGRVYFGGEPITPDFPQPWGLRMDGQSLWSIRKHGWFELGFNDAYFMQALATTGWLAAKHASADSSLADVWEARKADGQALVISASDPRLVVPAGTRDAAGIALCELAAQWGFFGPYVTLPEGTWTARVYLKPLAARQGRGTLDVCCEVGQNVLASRTVDLSALKPDENCLEIEATLDRARPNVEVRFYCDTSVTLSLDRIELSPTHQPRG